MKTCSSAAARLDGERGADEVRLLAADLGPHVLRHRAGLAGAVMADTGLAVAAAQIGLHEFRVRRQGGVSGERIGLEFGVDMVGIGPGQAFQRQAEADRAVAGDQEQVVAAEEPAAGLPAARAVLRDAPQRQHAADRRRQTLAEHAGQPVALQRVAQLRVLGDDVGRQRCSRHR